MLADCSHVLTLGLRSHGSRHSSKMEHLEASAIEGWTHSGMTPDIGVSVLDSVESRSMIRWLMQSDPMSQGRACIESTPVITKC
eukprot:1280125-Amphidinium_carterae.1